MTDAPRRDRPDLSRKLYYTISEVSELTGVKPHVLRYWEGEFPTLRPRKGRGGSRRYRRGDIEQILTIRDLLYEQGFRIAGARRHLETVRRRGGTSAPAAAQMQLAFDAMDHEQQLAYIRQELREIRDLLRRSREAVG